MSFGWLKTNASPIAIDFGVAALKALQIATGDAPSLIAASQIKTPTALLNRDEARLNFQIESISKLLKEGGFKGRRVICTVPSTCVLVQHLQIQAAGVSHMSSAIGEQLRRATGAVPSQLILRHAEVGEIIRHGEKRTEVICFAMPRDIVVNHMRALKAARLEVVGIHTEHMALMRLFDSITRRAEDQNLVSLYIDIGAGATKMVIAHGTDIALAKTIPLGAPRIAKALADAREKDKAPPAPLRRGPISPALQPHPEHDDMFAPAAAEAGPDSSAQAQREPSPAGVATAEADQRRDAQPPQGMVRVNTDPTDSADAQRHDDMGALLDEVNIAMRYHAALFPRSPVTRCIFVGGGASSAEVCRTIARSLRLTAMAADPLSRFADSSYDPDLDLDLRKPQPGWAVPLGLCVSPTDL